MHQVVTEVSIHYRSTCKLNRKMLVGKLLLRHENGLKQVIYCNSLGENMENFVKSIEGNIKISVYFNV